MAFDLAQKSGVAGAYTSKVAAEKEGRVAMAARQLERTPDPNIDWETAFS